MLKPNTIKKIKSIVGDNNVMTSIEDRLCYAYDATNQKFTPDIVIFPKDAGEVSKILKLANAESFPVVPRGAGTGFTGGALTINNGAVIVLTKMNRILDIDENNFTAEVEPGVVTYDFHREVEKRGLFYPPDPGSLKMCTLGGNVAECAGGPRAVKYGVTKDYVIGLEAVLPTGEIINTGTHTLKGVVGYDLTKLLTGSEGTLAIITKVRVRLLTKPAATKTMIAFFKTIDDAAKSVPAIRHKNVTPSKLEMLDSSTIAVVKDQVNETGIKIPDNTDALLIIEVDGSNIEDEVERIEEALKDNNVINVIIAKSDEEQEAIWDVRRKISPIISKIARKKINEDIVVPCDKLPDAVKMVRTLAKKYDLNIVTFGHAGDGNIHVNTMIDDRNADEVERAKKAVHELFENVIALNGSISGEHGVGTAKAPYLSLELGALEIDLMKRIKSLFDPNNILNPGKIFYG
ncbi:FAD-binding oxidoreductase [Thermodesulfobacteriota bacterium]